MINLVIRTDKDIQVMLDMAFRMAQSEDRYDVFYRTHPGYENWVTTDSNNTYKIEGDLINLRMMEILDYMDCECYIEGGLPNDWDVEPNAWDWTVFMEGNC